MRTAEPWRAPRTGIWKLRRRVPSRYRHLTTGDTIKVSTGTADRKEALRRWPDVLEQWEARLQSWEEALHHVSLTPARAREIAAGWAAHLANGAELDQGGMASPAFDLLVTVADPAVVPRVWSRIETHAAEALHLAGITATPGTLHLLMDEMEGAVRAAYAGAELARAGGADILGPGVPARASLPAAPKRLPSARAKAPAVSLTGLFDAWRAVATQKPNTVADTGRATMGGLALCGW